MNSSSIQNHQPHLESVLGPLSEEDDFKIRSMFLEIDAMLLGLARSFGKEQAGWEGTGLELTWIRSGQMDISSSVGAVENGSCVEYCVALRPSWYFGERSTITTWEIELSIDADCGHRVDCGGMHCVHEESAHAKSPMEAAKALHSATMELQRLAADHPINYWLKLASE